MREYIKVEFSKLLSHMTEPQLPKHILISRILLQVWHLQKSTDRDMSIPRARQVCSMGQVGKMGRFHAPSKWNFVSYDTRHAGLYGGAGISLFIVYYRCSYQYRQGCKAPHT